MKQFNPTQRGTLYALAAFAAWGLLPAYWKLVRAVPATEILAHRIVWSLLFVVLLVSLQGGWRRIRQTLTQPRAQALLLASTLLINVNWLVFIWAVNSNQIVETSLGYYINPLWSVVLGVVVLHERMDVWQWAAVALAAIGVVIMTVGHGKFPWIALVLAFSFGLYGLCKKLAPVAALTGLTVETGLVAPFWIAFLLYKHVTQTGALGQAALAIQLPLLLAGVITAIPLLCFARAAQMIPLARVGFLQYLTPTLSLALGCLVYHEPFTRIHAVSFGCIWLALLIYTVSQTSLFTKKNR